MTGIKEKLRQLDVKHTATPAPDKVALLQADPLFLKIDAETVTSEYGSCIIREKRFDLTFEHGGQRLHSFFGLPGLAFARAGGHSMFDALQPKDILFIDTETTGLAGGTGTYIFLIGIGYIEQQELIVRQFFMPDFQDELALLKIFETHLQDKTCIMSYNGKSYDVPLLKTRFALHRMPQNFDRMLHIDLLYTVRRLWKKSLQTCALADVESQILKLQRQNDVSGAEIPSVYFRFLKDRSFIHVLPIFKHNVQDILSMVSLISEINDLFEHRRSNVPANDLWIFRILRDTQLADDALDFHAVAVASSPFSAESVQLRIEQARLLKRLKRYDDALQIWKELITVSPVIEEPFEELAKYHEHVSGNYTQALEMLSRYEKRLETRNELWPDGHQEFGERWQKRKNRLQRKHDSSTA
jgi:uncharacterized protein